MSSKRSKKLSILVSRLMHRPRKHIVAESVSSSSRPATSPSSLTDTTTTPVDNTTTTTLSTLPVIPALQLGETTASPEGSSLNLPLILSSTPTPSTSTPSSSGTSKSDPVLAMPSSGASTPPTTIHSANSSLPSTPRQRASPIPEQSPTSPFICIPLYIYPNPQAWEPLVEAALAHPTSYFHAIVNPNNRPGSIPLPDENYVDTLQRLSALPNVTILGYIHIMYSNQPVTNVENNISKYAAWSMRDTFKASDDYYEESARIRIDGIFFDETPSDPEMISYMSCISRCAKRLLHSAKSGANGLVMLNPGVVVAPAYYDMADYVVAFEQAHEHWNTIKDEFLEGLGGRSRRQKTVVMVHTCPEEEAEVEGLVGEVRKAGICRQFLTEQVDGGYSQWPCWWSQYVDSVFLYQ